jgi:putative endonuclease
MTHIAITEQLDEKAVEWLEKVSDAELNALMQGQSSPAAGSVPTVENSTGQKYIGLSEDVQTRLTDHNSGVSKWTKNRGPWRLIWTSGQMDLSSARKLENALKTSKRGRRLPRDDRITASIVRLIIPHSGIVGSNPAPATNFGPSDRKVASGFLFW